MSLAGRIARIERQNGVIDPYAHLSDEELSEWIAELDKAISEKERSLNEPAVTTE